MTHNHLVGSSTFFRNSFQFVQSKQENHCHCYALCPSLLLSPLISLKPMNFLSLGEMIMMAKWRQSCQASKSHWYPYPVNLSAKPQPSQNWDIKTAVKPQDEKLFLRAKAGCADQKKTGATFTPLQQYSEHNIYWSGCTLTAQGRTVYAAKATSLFHVLPPSAVKIQACLVTEIAPCLKPRQSWHVCEIASASLCMFPFQGDRLGHVFFLGDHPDFKGFIFLPHKKSCLYTGTALWCGFPHAYLCNVNSDMKWYGHQLRGSTQQPFKDVFWLRSTRKKASPPAPSQ